MTIRVTINSIDDEGRGRGTVTYHHKPFNVAVRGAFSGDIVEATIERAFPHQHLLVCRASKHVVKGDYHVDKMCAHKGPCPACPLHGLSRPIALDLKRSRITQALHEANITFNVDEVIPHPHEFGYRQRVKLMVGLDPTTGKTIIGTYVPYSHHLREASACPYVKPSINSALQKIAQYVSAAYIKAIIARDSHEGVSVVFVCHTSIPDLQFNELKILVDNQDLVSITERIDETNSNSVLGGTITRRHGTFTVDPDAFCQPDQAQAQYMYDIVAEYLTQDQKSGYFVDAYAGIGGFSQALIKHGAKSIIAIEQAASSQKELSQLAVEAHACSVSDVIPTLAKLTLTGLVADPPKKGLMNDAEPLAKLGAARVVLVSCDPHAMTKDLRIFLQHGYIIDRILPIDLFGGTPAIETLVFMRKN